MRNHDIFNTKIQEAEQQVKVKKAWLRIVEELEQSRDYCGDLVQDDAESEPYWEAPDPEGDNEWNDFQSVRYNLYPLLIEHILKTYF